MKKFTDKRQREGEEYRVGDLVLLSTKDLKWQMKGRRSEKLTECFMGLYKVKGIISSNAIELELSKSIRIHPVVNVSRVWLYKPCHKLHLAISPSILHRFSRSQWLRKALGKTFRSVPVTSRGDQ